MEQKKSAYETPRVSTFTEAELIESVQAFAVSVCQGLDC